MTLVEAVVVLLGAALVVGELWFFLGPRRADAKTGTIDDGVQEISVLVKGGYHPDVITVEAGRPVRLLFYRDETADCTAHVVFDDLGIEQELPPFQTTPVEFSPDSPGDYHFRCGKSVIRGRVVVEVGRDGARANLGKGHIKHG